MAMLTSYFKTAFSILLITLCTTQLNAQNLLWQMGTKDHDVSEFANAPSDYDKFESDGFFITGISNIATDWPYVHPGPGDGWAGSQVHSFSIFFGISNTRQSTGNCTLTINMVDTHNTNPGSVKIRINDEIFEQKLPKGGGDESINGSPEKGKNFDCRFEFPTSLLKNGNNELDIINASGSWFLYDAIRMETPSGIKSKAVENFLNISSCNIEPSIFTSGNKTVQNLSVELKYAGPPKDVSLWYNNEKHLSISLLPGIHQYKCTIPEILSDQTFSCVVKENNSTLASIDGDVKPSGHRTIYILPHSHTDIGYTDIQTAIEDKQVENLRTGIRYAQETQDYPDGARFVWNVEVSWAADLYLNRLDKEEQDLFLEALQKGWISLNGMYLNELTGLCRPEELLRLFRYSTKLAQKTGAVVDAAMISDVPGYTWGTVTAMAQAGIKYFSVAPNYFDRIGDILVKWENKPFYWLSPSGKEKVLVWIPFKGYAWSHTIPELNDAHANDFLDQLEKMDYPYDIAYMRWSGHGDNAVPEKQISDFAKDWNEKHTWPRFVISSTGEAFRAFEEKYGDQLKEYSGDWTPYWEDGAGSSALETAMNRNSSDRLTQAEALYALSPGSQYPVDDFEKAWKNTLLYSEHTWGAWCSITDPENQMTVEQWDIKKGYADNADRMSRDLLEKNLGKAENGDQIEVVNTSGWKRSGLMRMELDQAGKIKSVIRGTGFSYPVQKLSDGSLVFFGEDIPALSSVRYTSSTKKPKLKEGFPAVTISGQWMLDNGLVKAKIDPVSGDLISLMGKNIYPDFADLSSGEAINQYLFFEGKDAENTKTSGKANIRIIEPGPLYALIEVRSGAPGCNSLTRRYSLTAGQDYIEIENIVDKKRAPMPEKIGDWYLAQNENKESVNFAFPFNVPGGDMILDLPIGSIVPWKDQIPSACKNWYTVGRYADISNDDYGVSWFNLDAPLVEIGEISANLVGSQSDPDVWRKNVKPTQTLYSWVMNNHWGTNYRQYQEGPVTFRYALRPHKSYDAAETYRMATGMSQPLLLKARKQESRKAESVITPIVLDSEGIVLISLKPADDGKGFIARLYNPGSEKQSGRLDTKGKKLWLSNTGEENIKEIHPDVELGPMELITVRIDR